MIYSQPGETFETSLQTSSTGLAGLVGTVGVRIMDGQGGTAVARTTSGIVETPAGSGIYVATITAPGVAGQYQIVWDTGGAEPSWAGEDLTVTATLPMVSVPVGVARPSVSAVAALLRARTVSGVADPDNGIAIGDELGTFTEATRPTAEQVEALIDMAVADVESRVGTDIPDRWMAEAQRLAALQAAALVEASFFPGELDSDRSAYRQYTAMYLSAIEALTTDAVRPTALRLV